MFRHVIPNAMRPVLAMGFLRFGHKLITVGALSYLGLGVQPPDSDWGAMLLDAQPYMERAPSLGHPARRRDLPVRAQRDHDRPGPGRQEAAQARQRADDHAAATPATRTGSRRGRSPVTPQSCTAVRIPRATFASIVTERLRTSIVNGSLEPGSQLSEVELATSFGVSRGPVREALQRLVQEGLLHSEPHRGVFVPVLTDEDVADIYVAREALESAAIRLDHRRHGVGRGVPRRSTGSSTRWRRPRPRGTGRRSATLDLEFHVALVEASGSQRLQRMFSTVISETRLCLGVLTAADARDDLVQEHRQICDLMQEGETDQALAVLKKHFDDAVVTLSQRQRSPMRTRRGRALRRAS